jgi:hypothetical protein
MPLRAGGGECLDEAAQNGLGRRAAIHEVHVVVLEARARELPPVIHLQVSHHRTYPPSHVPAVTTRCRWSSHVPRPQNGSVHTLNSRASFAHSMAPPGVLTGTKDHTQIHTAQCRTHQQRNHHLLVEPHNRRDAFLSEDGVVVLGRESVQPIADLESCGRWAGERDELAWQDLVEVAVFDFLIVLVPAPRPVDPMCTSTIRACSAQRTCDCMRCVTAAGWAHSSMSNVAKSTN